MHVAQGDDGIALAFGTNGHHAIAIAEHLDGCIQGRDLQGSLGLRQRTAQPQIGPRGAEPQQQSKASDDFG